MSIDKDSAARWIAWIEKRSARIVAVGLGLLSVLGLFYTLSLGDTLRFLPDESDYLVLSQNLVSMKSYTLDGEQPTAYRPPGYPLLLAAFRVLGVELPGLRRLNYVLLALTLWTLFRLLCRLSSPLAGIIGAAFGAGYGVLFFTAGTFYPQTFAAFLFISVLDRLEREGADRDELALKRTAPLSQGITGVLLAWLILTIPTFVFIVPVLMTWLIWRKKDWRDAIGLALAVSLCIGAWTARNLVILGAPVFVATNSGENLLLGNSPLASSNQGSQVDIMEYRQYADAQNFSEVERDRFFRQSAIEYWRTSPSAALRLYFEKFLNYFNFRNNLATQSEESIGRDLFLLVTYYPLLFMGTWRVVENLINSRIFNKSTGFELLIALLYLGSALVHALFFTRIRFRLPYDTLVILLAAQFLEGKLRQVVGNKSSSYAR